jgi:outer membrane protein OmpA-like peptidoglycan-associated protein
MHGRWVGRLVVGLVLIGATAFSACTGGAKKGAAIGGAAGALTGAIIGNQANKTGTGAVVGGAVGAAAGAIIGDYMAKQKKDLEKVPGATVTQEGDQLQVAFQSAILFDTNSSNLKAESKDNLQKMAKVLVQYAETDLVVLGHTDNTGSESYNDRLSALRAVAVKEYLSTQGVSTRRLQADGRGEAEPVSSNATADGRAKNRRVEVQIAANDALRAKAAHQAETR